jgi:hypothetical protein
MRLNANVQTKIKVNALKDAMAAGIDKTSNLHIHDVVLIPGETIMAGTTTIPITRETGLVFVDLAPAHNWAHPCEYHLYDARTGGLYRKVRAGLPPAGIELGGVSKTAFHAPVHLLDTRKRRVGRNNTVTPLTNALSAAPGERYAILFAGKAENRHTNDIEFLYRTLIDVYAFKPANVYVLNHDGSVNYFLGPSTSQTIGTQLGNWPGNGTPYRMNVTGQGTRAGFQVAFNAIAAQIKPEDMLFIHTNNHGGGPGDGVNDFCMFTYDAVGTNWTPYFVNDFIADLGTLPRFEVLMVMMEQCRSGGFIDPIINHSPAKWTQVATAVAASDYSLGGANFDPFAEDWIAGVNGRYADGTALSQVVDTTHDGRISASEAFAYASAVATPGDTPHSSASPADYGAYIFLGQPAHDLYLRDNLQDHGREPLIDGGISCSPDIVVFNQELLDPDATLATPGAQRSDTLGAPIEYGQDNFIYLRVQNRGQQPTAGSARLYWADPSVLPAPASWNEITNPASPLPIPAVAPGEMAVIGPIVWRKEQIPAKGHYCFIGTINSGDDPAPDPATIHTIDDYYRFIRLSNNATWRNFDVIDLFSNSMTQMEFTIQGWPRAKLSADLMVDLTNLPVGAKVTLRLLKRLSGEAALENAVRIESSEHYQELGLTPGTCGFVRNMPLEPSDHCQASLQIVLPGRIASGSYRIAVAELIGGKEMGRVTRMLAVGAFPYMANRHTREVHVANCEWALKIARTHKEAYRELNTALAHGYDGCAYCLPQHNKG